MSNGRSSIVLWNVISVSHRIESVAAQESGRAGRVLCLVFVKDCRCLLNGTNIPIMAIIPKLEGHLLINTEMEIELHVDDTYSSLSLSIY